MCGKRWSGPSNLHGLAMVVTNQTSKTYVLWQSHMTSCQKTDRIYLQGSSGTDTFLCNANHYSEQTIVIVVISQNN